MGYDLTDTPKAQVFTIKGKFPGVNEYVDACRKNKHVGARMKREQQRRVTDAITEYGIKPMETPVDVYIRWHEPNKKRDKDNVRFAIKFILDGLVEAGIISNDKWKNISDLGDDYLVDRDNPRVVVFLNSSELL